MSPEDKSFNHGLGVILGWLARIQEPTLVAQCMKNNGITIEQLREAKVISFDLRPIGRALKLG